LLSEQELCPFAKQSETGIMFFVKNLIKSLLLFILSWLLACFPVLEKQVQYPNEAIVPVRFFQPHFHDDMDIGSLILAIERNIAYLDRLDPEAVFQYGPHEIKCRQVIETQKYFISLIIENDNLEQLNNIIKKNFQIYHAAGRVGNNKVLFTGYFEPVFDGSMTPDEVFRFPVYRKPDDLVEIDLSDFNDKYRGEKIIARIEGEKVIPYYARHHIEMENALHGRGLEIAWLRDPVDVAFLHIQGSGRLRLPDGKYIMVGYEGSNGRPYRSIGRYMLEQGFLTLDEISMQSIRSYLSENPEVIQDVLNYNPSYVFFQLVENGPLGNINVPLTPGRSLALDSKLFPKGALCFLSCRKPIEDDYGNIKEWKDFSRFVLNQDTGGAIKGAGRADIFWGSGPYAELAAGHLKHDGELYILIKKP